MRRVLLLLPSLTADGGGIERHVRQLVGALARLAPGARFDAVLAREPALRRPELLEPSLRTRLRVFGVSARTRSARLAELALRAAQAGSGGRADLVLCGHPHHAPIALALARAARAPLLTLAHGVEVWGRDRGLVAWALRRSDRIACVSSFTADELARTGGVAPQRLSVLHPEVDVERFQPGAVSAVVAEQLAAIARPRLLTVARLARDEGYKGIDTVLRALAGMAQPPSYLVVGRGDDAPRLRELARELKVPAHFFDQVSDRDLPDFYRASDLFVMPSSKEGFGMVFSEALASGVPVLAGDAGGARDALAGGALGMLVDPSRPDAIAQAIGSHLRGETDARLCDPLHLRAEVERRFGPAAFRESVARLLEQTIESRAADPA